MIIKNPQYAIIGQDVSDTTATPADVLAPKEFHQADGQKVQGTIPTYAGSKTVTPSENTQTLATENKYVNGDIVVNPIPSNYKDTAGTDATASDILSGKKAVTGAGMITGNYVPPVAEENDVNFYDYDGTIVASYSAADFANLSELPANPSHEGLVADGWNWTLANAKTYVAAYGKLNIGQMYHTASGKTEYDVEINEVTGMTATLNNNAEKDWGDGTVDTNTSHTYATAGNYTIKMGGTSLPSIQDSKKVRAVRIASGVTSVGDNVFRNCRLLQSVTLPSSITSIGNYAFDACGFSSITIPSGKALSA